MTYRLMATEFMLGMVRKFWSWILVMVASLVDTLKSALIY